MRGLEAVHKGDLWRTHRCGAHATRQVLDLIAPPRTAHQSNLLKTLKSTDRSSKLVQQGPYETELQFPRLFPGLVFFSLGLLHRR